MTATPTAEGSVSHMNDWLAAEERARPGVFVQCGPCQDHHTLVTDGVEHPCPHCRLQRYKAWRLADGLGMTVTVKPHGPAVVTAPPVGDCPVQPCYDTTCNQPRVYLLPAGAQEPYWAELEDVELAP